MSETNSSKNTGEPWSDDDVQQLRELADDSIPTRLIGLRIGRTEDAIRDAARELGLSLAAANRPPYGAMS